MKAERRQEIAERFERTTSIPEIVLSIVFLILLVLPYTISLSSNQTRIVNALTFIIWIVFVTDFAIKLLLATDRLRYLLSHWTEALIVVLPLFRPLLLLRFFAVSAHLGRRMRTLLVQQTSGILVLGSVSAIAVCALLVWLAERKENGNITTFGDAVWWGAATITTVGYGDVYPITYFGRVVGVVLMVAGISLFGLLTARVSAFLVNAQRGNHQQHLETHLIPGQPSTDYLSSQLAQLAEQQAELLKRLDAIEDKLGEASGSASSTVRKRSS